MITNGISTSIPHHLNYDVFILTVYVDSRVLCFFSRSNFSGEMEWRSLSREKMECRCDSFPQWLNEWHAVLVGHLLSYPMTLVHWAVT